MLFMRCVGLCLFPLPLGVRDWLRLVIVALPGLFFLPFSYDLVFFRFEYTCAAKVLIRLRGSQTDLDLIFRIGRSFTSHHENIPI